MPQMFFRDARVTEKSEGLKIRNDEPWCPGRKNSFKLLFDVVGEMTRENSKIQVVKKVFL
jgi:hypothetical protein